MYKTIRAWRGRSGTGTSPDFHLKIISTRVASATNRCWYLLVFPYHLLAAVRKSCLVVHFSFWFRYHVAAVSINSSNSDDNTSSSERFARTLQQSSSLHRGIHRYSASSLQRTGFATFLRSGLFPSSGTYSISISSLFQACYSSASWRLSPNFGGHPPPRLCLPLVSHPDHLAELAVV